MNVKISHNIEETIERMQEDLRAYKKGLSENVFRALTLVEAEIKQNIRSRSGLNVRTGTLLNSIGASKKVFEERGFIVGEIGPEGVPYAAIHEFGGTILPKNKKSLAIPSAYNRRRDGLPINTTSDLMSGKLGKTFIAKGTIFLQEGPDKITPMFYLRSSVTIPARPYMAPALAATQDKILQHFGLFLSASFPDRT